MVPPGLLYLPSPPVFLAISGLEALRAINKLIQKCIHCFAYEKGGVSKIFVLLTGRLCFSLFCRSVRMSLTSMYRLQNHIIFVYVFLLFASWFACDSVDAVYDIGHLVGIRGRQAWRGETPPRGVNIMDKIQRDRHRRRPEHYDEH